MSRNAIGTQWNAYISIARVGVKSSEVNSRGCNARHRVPSRTTSGEMKTPGCGHGAISSRHRMPSTPRFCGRAGNTEYSGLQKVAPLLGFCAQGKAIGKVWSLCGR
jgi:hypothetical protein